MPQTITTPNQASGLERSRQLAAARPFRWIVAQEGPREHYSTAAAFHQVGQLRLLYADIWCRWGRSLLRRGPAGVRNLATRFNPEIPADRVVSFSPCAILWRSLYHHRFARLPLADQLDLACRFGEWFAGRVARHLKGLEMNPEQDLFFGFNSSSLETIEALKDRRIFTVVDQVDPGQVEERLVIEEARRWPGWQDVHSPVPQHYWERIRAEWNAADLVLVNSDWSKQALVQQRVRAERIIVVPLVLDLHRWVPARPFNPRGPLKVLWLGNLILRKGIQYLVEAARLLQGEAIEFLVAGPVGISAAALATFPRNMKLLGKITRDQLGAIYNEAHVFVLPTISDGFAMTQLEAMAHGLPVIVTPNCGRVVTDGVDGFVVPARDSAALASALSRVNDDRDRLLEMSHNATKTVASFGLPQNAVLLDEAVQAIRRRGQGS
jgi:glycosyltransferase involved in cell wall biosynthesis